MKNRSTVRLASSFFMMFMMLSFAVVNLASAEEATTFDWQPPAFSAITASGNTFRYPEDLQGPTIVLFWATWCPYCKALMPHLQSIVDEHEYQIRVLALNFREDGEPAAVLDEYGYEFLLFPTADPVAESWGVKTTPGLFLVDSTGRAVFSLRAIPDKAFPTERFAENEELKRYQDAARKAPFWAAQLRLAIDRLSDPQGE